MRLISEYYDYGIFDRNGLPAGSGWVTQHAAVKLELPLRNLVHVRGRSFPLAYRVRGGFNPNQKYEED